MTELSGTLTRDARYLVRVPGDWNGVLLNDLDYAGGWETTPARGFLLERGYGLSGSSRIQSEDRVNIEHQLAILDLVEREFGRPRHIVQIGCSGGGNIALMMAEQYPDRVDGSLPMGAASTPIVRHMYGDFLFTLRAVLAPGSDLMVVNTTGRVAALAFDHPEIARWDEVLVGAQATPLGRARIALVVTLCQYPAWAGGMGRPVESDPPDPADSDAVQRAMFDTARTVVAGAVPFMLGTSGPFDQEVDYSAFYDNADPAQKRVVDALYLAAGGDATADLQRIADAERVDAGDQPADPEFSYRDSGRLRVPTLHSTTMDSAVPPVAMTGYAAMVRQHGLTSLYRQAFIARPNHCGFGVSELAALVETLVARLTTGEWGDVGPEALNALAAGFGVDEPRFVPYGQPEVLNRAYFADA